ncbi:hypothetical protein [Paracoccus sp. (in: a-proteobacteria)]|uniref:hypothetical protein n=1 Tax=Paracoccus sp. TaxID=267 RepID=UPI002AFE3570|nr:hypothetical protein [Paracoccus sp. (in: a-proteobacteria)]
MRRGNRNRFTPFAALSRHRQRDAFVKLRWKILRDTPTYGGLFTSDVVLDEPGRPDAYRQWFDVLFLGLDGRRIWNATITTGGLALWERIQDLASEQTRARLTEMELEEEARWKFAPAHYVGPQKFYRVIRPEPRRHDALDGLTIREHQERVASEILHDTPPQIHKSFRLDRSYRYGIGLEIIVNSRLSIGPRSSAASGGSGSLARRIGKALTQSRAITCRSRHRLKPWQTPRPASGRPERAGTWPTVSPIAGRASMRHCNIAWGQFFQIGALENHPVGVSILIGLHAHKGVLDKLVSGGPGQEDDRLRVRDMVLAWTTAASNGEDHRGVVLCPSFGAGYILVAQRLRDPVQRFQSARP